MKMDQEFEFEDDLDDEYDESQYEFSYDLSEDFLLEEVIPTLLDFDFNNANEDYIPGVATFGLYARLIDVLLTEGFTKEQLHEIIEECQSTIIDSTVH
jgi:hypothetical protein